ncbi:MAG: DNA-directed RNA polymerase subunit H [Candidatus Altiarchaeales archaeon]|nr:DNA-directed RNA polymerase subunit H [Candidatus Altiarchaeales archaeon]
MLNHRLVPKHEILSSEEALEILTKYNITVNEMPQIKLNDPAIKDFKPSEGDIVKITRENPSTGKSFYYRVVVEG